MLIIVQIAPPNASSDIEGKQRDSLILSSEQRRWVRGRFTTTGGREIALALPTGTTLEPDSIAWVGPDWYLAIEAAPESVLAIVPADSRASVRIAFEVGNRHFPLAMDGDALLVPDDTAMVQLLDRIGARWERRLAVFQPIGKAHSHDDPHPNAIGADRLRDLASDHSHDHSHDDSQVHSIERPNGR
jgi:urease accessory protein